MFQTILSDPFDITCLEDHVDAHSPIPKSYRNGSSFSVSDDILYRMKLPPTQFVSLDKKNVNPFVFVTAVSENHFSESIDAIASVQAHFPRRKIYYYDIGLNEEQKHQV